MTPPTKEEVLALYDYDRERGLLISRVYSARRPIGESAGVMKENGCIISIKTAPTKRFLRRNLIWLLETGEWPQGRVANKNDDLYDDRFSNLFLLPGSSGEVTRSLLLSLYQYDRSRGTFHRVSGLRGSIKGSNGAKNPRGYLHLHIAGKTIRAHQAVWFMETGEWPRHGIDHINGITDDNRFENLRQVPHGENCKNRALNKNSKTGVSGVTRQRNGKYVVYINYPKKTRLCLGAFSDFFDAVCARKSAENRYGYHTNHGLTKEARAKTT